MSWVAGVTDRIRIAVNVLNLPLRDPAVLARSATSLDLLSGGRLEMALGAGAFWPAIEAMGGRRLEPGGFWDAIEAMGGRRLSPGQSIQALEEAIAIVRQIWDTSTRSGVRVDGEYYQVQSAKRGPAPAHDIGIWIGAYKPRILRMTGRLADGWLPSLGYLPGGVADLTAMNKNIDEGAESGGREPSAIRRFLNIGGQFSREGRGLFVGPPQQWAEQIVEIAMTYGTSGFIVAADDQYTIETYAKEVAPAARELLASANVK